MINVIKDLTEALKKWPWFAKTRLGKFLIEVLVEMVGVTWPSKDEVVSSTVVVVVTLVVVATFLYVVNLALSPALTGLGQLIAYVAQIFS